MPRSPARLLASDFGKQMYKLGIEVFDFSKNVPIIQIDGNTDDAKPSFFYLRAFFDLG